MKSILFTAFLFVTLGLGAADGVKTSFSDSLSPEQKTRLGLSALTPEQLAALDAAISDYQQAAETVAVAEAEKKAAEDAVSDYKKKKEPSVIARSLELFKRKAADEQVERMTVRIVGTFRGWKGGTYFPTSTGQVWRQTESDVYELPPVKDAEVELFKSANGYWRLKVPDGAWVTVKRLQ